MDGDSTAKTLDSGANSTIRTTDNTDGIHESSSQTVLSPLFPPQDPKIVTQTNLINRDTDTSRNQNHRHRNIRLLLPRKHRQDVQSRGAIGGTADKIGGPLAKDGAIGWVNSNSSCSSSSTSFDSSSCEELEQKRRRKDIGEWEIREWVEVLLESVPFVG